MKMALKNCENDVEISFKTVEKEDEEVDNIQVRFFFSRRMYLIRIRKSGYYKAPFSSRKFSTLSKIQNMKIFNLF